MGKSKLFTDPVELQKKIDSYFEFKKTDFAYKYDVVKSGAEAGKELQIKVKNPPIVLEFASYLGVTSFTTNNYKNKCTEEIKHKIDNVLLSENLNINQLVLSYYNYGIEREEMIFFLFARAHEQIQTDTIQGAMSGRYEATVAKIVAGLNDTVNIQQTISINALPVNISNNIIDLTDSDYKVIESDNNKAIE